MERMFVLVLLVATIAITGSDAACKTLEELDQCAFDANFFLNPEVGAPTDDASMVATCNRMKNSITCINDYVANCMKSAKKSSILERINLLQQHVSKQCDNDAERARLLGHIQCFVDPKNIDDLRLCGERQRVMLENVAKLSTELRRGGGCCTNAAFRQCVSSIVKERCPAETVEYYKNLFKNGIQERIQLICNEMANVDACDSKYDAATWTNLKKTLEINDVNTLKTQHKYRSILPTVIQMIEESS